MNRDPLVKQIRRVTANGNCSGCGACALLSKKISMRLNDDGYLRPVIDSGVENEEELDRGQAAKYFRAICPGVGVTARSATGLNQHEIFGPYVSSWQGWAADPTVRYTGSSGGVITAIARWLLESEQASSVVGSTGGTRDPRRTEVAEISDADMVESLAGSRYAPVGNVAAYKARDPRQVFIGKPCEATAAGQVGAVLGSADTPVLISFFCAGTPSQEGTDQLVNTLVGERDFDDVRYRGSGWPGSFRVHNRGNLLADMSYDESWGRHVGRQIQWRCKICPDGTGGNADISVGDFWAADENGYPLFDSADGNSVVIARSPRGAQILRDACEAGILILAPLQLDLVRTVQPLQVERKITLLGRLIGRAIALKRVPRFRGFGLILLASRNVRPVSRAAAGTARRSVLQKSKS